jgi:hypothetical protein
MRTRSNFPRLMMPRLGTATSQILESNQRPLSRRQLHQKAHGHVAEAVAATCLWDRNAVPPLGDYHSVVFNARPARNVGVFVQLWSLPDAPALVAVSSGAEHVPSKRWLPPDLPARMERMGFEVGHSGNYQREFRIRSRRDVERIAHLVIDIFYDAYDYRGTVPIDVQVVFDGRASEEIVYDSFTPAEIAQIATRLGYAARILPANAQSDATATVALRKGAAVVEVVLGDRAEDSNLYASGFVGSPVIPAAAKRRARKALRRGQPRLHPDAWRVGVTLNFDGGVTAEWVGQRLEYGMKLVAATTRGTRGRASGSKFYRSAPTVEPDWYRSLFSSIGV